jgi:hypothetical protein
MSIAVTYGSTLTVQETLGTNVPDISSPVLTHGGFNLAASLTALTTPPVSKTASFVKSLSGGTGTIDLTNLLGTNGAAVDGTTLKVQAVHFFNPSTHNITLTFGASNPYNLCGSSWSKTLYPGEDWLNFFNSGPPTIDSTHKNIDLSGTGTDTLDCQIVMG